MTPSIGARPWVGVDLGSHSLKLLALQSGVGAARHAVAEVALAPNPSAEQLAHCIAEGLSQMGLGPRQPRGFTLGVSGPDVLVKQIQLPLMDEQEIPGALRFEARKHLPFDPATLVLDYQSLGRFPSEKKVEVLLAAVSQQRLERTLAPLRLLGVEPAIVDAAPLALSNALARGAATEGEARVLLDIGHQGSWFALHPRTGPYFARRLEWGGADLTRALADGLTIPIEEAEEWKLEAGRTGSSLRVRPDGPEMLAVARGVEQLAEQVRRSLAFYRTLGSLPDPLTLWISGNTVRLPGFAGRLSESLGIPVLTFEPRGDGPDGDGPQYAQAYGLAWRAA